MVPDISNCIGSPEGYSDWMLQGPAAGGYYMIDGVVAQCRDSGTLRRYTMEMLVSDAEVSRLAGWGFFDLPASDFTVVVNGIAAIRDQNITYDGDTAQYLIGTKVGGTCGGLPDGLSPSAYVYMRLEDEYCDGFAAIMSINVFSFVGVRLCVNLGGATPSYSDAIISLQITHIPTATTILDVEFSIAETDGHSSNFFENTSTCLNIIAPTDPLGDCRLPTGISGGPWEVVVNSGDVRVADGVTWITLA